MKARRGFSATEVIIATSILALAMVPMITMLSGGAKPTAMSEYHLVAQTVAAHLIDRVIEKVQSVGFTEMERIPTGQEVALAQTQTYVLPTEAALGAVFEGHSFMSTEVFLTNLSEQTASLVQVKVIVSWTLPGSPKPSQFVMKRLLCRPELGLTADYVPRQEPARGGP